MKELVYLVPLFPLIGFIINGLFWKRIPKQFAGILATVMVLCSFIVSLAIFMSFSQDNTSHTVHLFDFINVANSKLQVPFAFQIDNLSSTFLLIITGIGTLIHLYSTGYMKGDKGYTRYFAYLNFFVFAMLLLVLGANYVMMFIGWEGVGLASYLLIGFWFERKDYTNASKKAFIMNRIGDLGFLVGMLLTLYHFGSLNYDTLFPQFQAMEAMPIHNWIALSFFVGAMGKSAQIPLYTWLPDAMAGPTPVSALIHAATMVTAGIYMIARSNALYNIAPMAQQTVAWVGVLTAFFAATIAMKQYDIKKVLAYSTVSQLGYMFLALGVGSYVGGVFHMMTHAFFKALLFLAAGSVIYGMHHEQDLRSMGGLRKKMPITHITFLVGCLAIAGVPGLSGFFSKDEVLAATYSQNKLMYAVAIITAFMTAFYMFRLYFYVFWGTFRGTKKQAEELHESPVSMTLPLMLLAVCSVVAGYIGLPVVLSDYHWLSEWLSPVVQNFNLHHLDHTTEWVLMGGSVLLVIIAIFTAKRMTSKAAFKENAGVAKLMEEKWHVDELYDRVIVKPLFKLSQLFDKFVERIAIDGGVNGVGRFVDWSSSKLRLLQSGQVGNYFFGIIIGIISLLLVSILTLL